MPATKALVNGAAPNSATMLICKNQFGRIDVRYFTRSITARVPRPEHLQFQHR